DQEVSARHPLVTNGALGAAGDHPGADESVKRADALARLGLFALSVIDVAWFRGLRVAVDVGHDVLLDLIGTTAVVGRVHRYLGVAGEFSTRRGRRSSWTLFCRRCRDGAFGSVVSVNVARARAMALRIWRTFMVTTTTAGTGQHAGA